MSDRLGRPPWPRIPTEGAHDADNLDPRSDDYSRSSCSRQDQMGEANQAAPSDAELVLSALSGDRDSFGHLVARHRDLLLAMCRRVLGQGGAAEDAAQEAVLEAMVNLDRLEKPDSFGAWLSGIGLNVCRRWLRRADNRFVVLLEEPDGNQGLPIWIGPHEGTAIAMLLERAEMPRPMTFRFLWSMLEAAGSRLAEVRINRLSEGTFYAEAVVKGPKGQAIVDARPSDAIALSLLADAPIRVSREVLTEVEREGTGSRSRFEAERDRYVEGPGEIVQRTRREWEVQIDQLRPR